MASVILAANRQEYPPLPQFQHPVLQIGERFADPKRANFYFSGPSSPITPPHTVLSRSKTRHFRNRPYNAPIRFDRRPATAGSASILISISVWT